MKRNPGSFRDPAGNIFERDGRIFRTVTGMAAQRYEAARDAGVFEKLVRQNKLVSLEEVDLGLLSDATEDVSYLLEHERLSHISYPYEWSFPMLKAAALLHLDIQLELLEDGFSLSDATAYNVQFNGVTPVFIDHLSVHPYREGELWLGHKQFCEQFLNPLLMRTLFDIPHNSWFRGNHEGILVSDLAKLLRTRHYFSWKLLSHIILQNKLQVSHAGKSSDDANTDIATRKLSKAGFKAMLQQLRSWINGLTPKGSKETVWGDYADNNTYNDAEKEKKQAFIAQFVQQSGAESLIDLGCNTGEYSQTALESGANRVIGFDFDQSAIEQAYRRAVDGKLNFTPLYLDAKNPSPDQGWQQLERPGFAKRAKADAVVALAFEHHLAIAHNIPLDQVVSWISDIAPTGIIEFVPKSDPTIQKMLALREDIFPNYTKEAFEAALQKIGKIEKQETISDSGRTLYVYSR